MIPKEIIDNSEGNKLVSFLNSVLKKNPKTRFDVATAFFNIQAFAMLKENLNGVERFSPWAGNPTPFRGRAQRLPVFFRCGGTNHWG